MTGGSETAQQGLPQASSLFGDLLDRFVKIVGPEAARGTFHFASVQEGARLARGSERSIHAALRRIDGVARQKSQVTEERKDLVRITIGDSSMLTHPADDVRTAVVLGLIEGMLQELHGTKYVGALLPHQGMPERIVEFRRA